MNLRDEVETVIRAWDAHETDRGATAIIDYDCHPSKSGNAGVSDTYDQTDGVGEAGRTDESERASGAGREVAPASSRLAVFERLTELRQAAEAEQHPSLVPRLTADLAYLRALMGERAPLEDYVQATQGCSARGWPAETLDARRDQARHALDALGVTWGPTTTDQLIAVERPIPVQDAADAIRAATATLEPLVRELTGSSAPYHLTIETTNVDAYWAYWLDGAGAQARLRLNLRHARFTEVRARQFALHEVLGHALQCASWAQQCTNEDVPWVRLMSVHAPYQVLLEGLAQTLPLFVTPDDQALMARIRFAHYQELVQATLHIAINNGRSVDDCARYARDAAPFWTDDEIADTLTDRGTNPLLRSYLWAYPAGIDWFVALADAEHTPIQELMHAAYREPLTPTDLHRLWPAGPAIGGG